MIKVYSSPDWMVVQTFKTVLESYGIACEVKDEFPIATTESIAIMELWVLWVLDDASTDEARNILAQSEDKDQPSVPSWTCRKCGELIGGQFDQCWQCGNRRPLSS